MAETKQFGNTGNSASLPLTGTETLSVLQGGALADCTAQDIANLGASGATGNLVAGSNVTLTGTLTSRLLGAGNVTIAAASGPVVHIGTATVAGAAATVLTISGLNLSTDQSYLVQYELDNATGSTSNISLYYNADTTATNYNQQGLLITGTSATASRGNNAIVDTLAANETVTGYFVLKADRDGRARAVLQSNRAAAASIELIHKAHVYNTATNITGITLSASVASSIAIGSSIKVFKVSS